MLDVATTPKAKKAKPDGYEKLPISPAEIIARFKDEVGDKVLCNPVLGAWYGRLGGVLKGFEPKFTPDDLEIMLAWIKTGGLDSWPNGAPTFENAIYQFAKWTNYSRAWKAKGCGPIGKANVTGAEAGSTDALWASFKPK